MIQLSSITVKINDETDHQDITQLHFDVSSQFSAGFSKVGPVAPLGAMTDTTGNHEQQRGKRGHKVIVF